MTYSKSSKRERMTYSKSSKRANDVSEPINSCGTATDTERGTHGSEVLMLSAEVY